MESEPYDLIITLLVSDIQTAKEVKRTLEEKYVVEFARHFVRLGEKEQYRLVAWKKQQQHTLPGM